MSSEHGDQLESVNHLLIAKTTLRCAMMRPSGSIERARQIDQAIEQARVAIEQIGRENGIGLTVKIERQAVVAVRV